MRGNKSLADDLSVRQGAVSSRVALLLRSAEAKPSLPRFVFGEILSSSLQFGCYAKLYRLEGGPNWFFWLPCRCYASGTASSQPTHIQGRTILVPAYLGGSFSIFLI